VPNSELSTTLEAIEFFRSLGFHASEWSGGSISVAAGLIEDGPIKRWSAVVRISPTSDGWVLTNFRYWHDPGPPSASSLTHACHQAVDALKSWLSHLAALPPETALERTREV
jgi:hypothetical protein